MLPDPSIWKHIAQLRPQLLSHIHVYTHWYRNERWHILHDKASGQYLRFNERAYSIIGRFDGTLSLEEIYDYANDEIQGEPIEKEEIISLLGQLNAAEVLRDGLPIDAQDLFHQYRSQKRKKRQRALMNPLSIKLPLFYPDKFLNRLTPLARHIFTPLSLGIWFVTVLVAVMLALAHSNTLVHEVQGLNFSPEQLIILWVIYPLIKALHELFHGLALKVWDGEVNEAGINLLLFIPVPYVDATASLGFQNRWRRIIVGSAGIVVELFIAALALFLWLLVEPGIVKEVALNIMLIASISTLLFNGNPLLKYDGYFIFEDLLEIPNLATRAKRYYFYLIQKYLLKSEEVLSPVTAEGEEKWFLFYGFFSPLYRLIILFGIALYLSNHFFVLGVALAAWAIIMQVFLPLAKGIIFLLYSKTAKAHQKQSFEVLLTTIAIFILIMIIPVPTTTYTQGIITSLGKSKLTADVSGFVSHVLVAPGTEVKKGQALLKLNNPELQAQYEILKAKITELQAKIGEQRELSRVTTEILKEDLHALESEFSLVSTEVKNLVIYAQTDGEFVLSQNRSLLGQYIEHGHVLAYIINPKHLIIQTLIPQSRIGLLKNNNTSAQIILNNLSSKAVTAQIIHQTPQAVSTLPALALSFSQGGKFRTDPNDRTGLKLDKEMFQIDLKLPVSLQYHTINSKVYVRFDHGFLPISQQISLYLNQLFLSHFYTL